MRSRLLMAAALAILLTSKPALGPGESLQANLLVVGGNEAACAAAVQAARMGVTNVMLVSDCAMLGGQYSAEGVGCVDERVFIDGENVDFPRSGLALEIVRAIESYNERRYGKSCPGNCWSATRTIEPRPAADIFEKLLSEQGGRIRVMRGRRPVRAMMDGVRVIGVCFDGGLTVLASITIDASDWGDVIRLSGSKYFAGVDPQSRFGEKGAPRTVGPLERMEMNPMTWTMTLVEKENARPIPKPADYDPANYPSGDIWSESGVLPSAYAGHCSPYIQRRLVDTRHYALKDARETIQLNATAMDYPLCAWPARVAKRLEALKPGLSQVNFVDLPVEAKEIVFSDMKNRSLGYLYFLQNDNPPTVARMRKFELVDDFGTADRLPPKPYVREGLRLAAVKVVTENDVAAVDGDASCWASCPDDAAFGFQFHIDFHPTRRAFDADDPNVWKLVHTAERNWSAKTKRAFFPYAGFVPVETEGLLGAGKNIGVSSIVQAALRLHPQMVLSGQCAGALAATAVCADRSPRTIVSDPVAVRALQEAMVKGVDGRPGVAIWAWQDLVPGTPAFLSANLPVVRGTRSDRLESRSVGRRLFWHNSAK